MIYETLFNNSTLIIMTFSLVHIFAFYALGAIVQDYFSFKKSNRILSIPVGYITWSIMTLFSYVLPIIFGLDKVWFSLMGSLKELSILFIIVLYYKSWAPSYKELNTRGIFRAPIGYAAVIIAITMVLLLIRKANVWDYDHSFSTALFILKYQILEKVPENITLPLSNTPIFNTGIGLSINIIVNENEKVVVNFLQPSSLQTMEKFESLYYWIMMTDASLVSVSTNDFIEIVMPTLITVTIASSILWAMVDSEKSIISYLYSSVILLLICLLEAYIGPYKQMFYVVPLLVIAISLLFNYSNQVNPNDNLLTTSLISLLALVTVTHWSLPILIIMGILIVGLSIIKNGFIVKILYRFIISISVLVIGYALIMFLDSLNKTHIKFTNQFIVVITLSIIFAAIITPLRSLARSSNRRKDLVTFESNAKNKKIKNTLIFSISLTLASLIAMLIFYEDILSNIEGYFLSINEKLWVGILVYVIAIICPTILILFIDKKYGYVSILSTLPYLSLILNPVTFTLMCRIAKWDYEILLIFVPEIIIASIWVVTEAIKLIPEEWKI